MINYMNTKYNLKEPCGCPKKDANLTKDIKGLDFCKFSISFLKISLSLYSKGMINYIIII